MSSKPKEDEVKRDPCEAVDRSCRGPVLFLAFSAVTWFLVYSLFALLAGVKVHAPGMMADSAWLAYGRIQPASQLALQFGFLTQLGLAISAWILSHRGKTVLVDGGYLVLGGMLWNLGVTLGFLGILNGNASGLEGLPMPGKVMPLLFFGFVLVGLSLVQTNNRRTDEEMNPAQWFLFAATLWLPWVLAGSYLLIHFFNAKGVVANIVDWWFIHNFARIYLTFVGLGTLFHFLLAMTGRTLEGRGYAQFAFWVLLLFGSVGGVAPGAPVPAWLPALSTVTAVFYFFGVVAVCVCIKRTISGASVEDKADGTAYDLMRLAALIFISVSVLNVFFAFPGPGAMAQFTTYGPGMDLLFNLGFVGLTLIAALYHIFPRLAVLDFCPKMTGVQTMAIILGVFGMIPPVAFGGLMSGDATLGSSYYFASVGDLLLLVGSAILFLNFLGAILLSIKNCDCLAGICCKGEKKETNA
ncbi:MAG: cbb3-type cytochrome c oxidase subunit I [Verrucomicrobiota bacterium]|jgi:cytochrome c oxidase cbb3-type subunit 1|nr:cbb3-type cytochrome c oxidase subunit I [Verrucomicrobiota bacterium]